MGDPSRISRDFEDVTSMRTLTGGIPPTGYYVHEEQDGTATTDDDQKIARFWDSGTETFFKRIPGKYRYDYKQLSYTITWSKY